MDMTAIKRRAYDLMGETSSHAFKERGNKYYHGERAAALAVRLRERLFPAETGWDGILTVAAWFHDVRNGVENHARLGAEVARETLEPYCAAEELAAIRGIIAVHDDRDPEKGYSDLIKLHQDADHLDHFGTFDIWMSFLYAAPHGQTILDTLGYLQNERPGENERYRRELNYEVSRAIFDEKTAFLQSFTERFAVEATGGIWDAERLLR